MKTSFDELELSLENFAEIGPQFRVLIFYGDRLARNHAKRLCEHLMESRAGCRLETFCWDVKHPKILEGVVEAVALADMIFVASCDISELPVELQSAMQIGLFARRVEGGALVALLGRKNIEQRVPSALHISLQEMACRAGLKFFPGMFEIPEEHLDNNFDSIHERANRRTPTLEGILHHVIAPMHYATN